MKQEIVDEIIECLPKERTVFRYFKDRYALMLLANHVGCGKKISEIKQSKYARLLNKKSVKSVLAGLGKNLLCYSDLDTVWPQELHHFVLTLGSWNGSQSNWEQTSRKGWNLVLQLNFSNQHDLAYKKLVKPEYEQVLNSSGHPVFEQNGNEYFRETLAWARIDVDFDSNEALIEEIQSDWVREADDLLNDAMSTKSNQSSRIRWWDVEGKIEDIIFYCNEVITPYRMIWAEAMLAATIDLIRNELGIYNIHYHTAITGAKVKRISYTKPPVSLYEKLPKRFCFTRSSQAPEFLQADKRFYRLYKKLHDPEWFSLDVK